MAVSFCGHAGMVGTFALIAEPLGSCRGLRRAMHDHALEALALHPEERRTNRPTCEQVYCLFTLTQRQVLTQRGQHVTNLEPELTELQRQPPDLLGVPESAYTAES